MTGKCIDKSEMQDEYKQEPGTVIAADFYHANTLLPLSDAEIVAKVKQNLDTCEPAFQAAQVTVACVYDCWPRIAVAMSLVFVAQIFKQHTCLVLCAWQFYLCIEYKHKRQGMCAA